MRVRVIFIFKVEEDKCSKAKSQVTVLVFDFDSVFDLDLVIDLILVIDFDLSPRLSKSNVTSQRRRDRKTKETKI